MLYQHVSPAPQWKPAWRRHPLVTGATAVIVGWLLVNGSYLPVAVGAAVMMTIYLRRRRRVMVRRDAGLRARADYEHRLTLAGDPRGIHGRYPPVQAGWFTDPQSPWLLRYFDGAVWTGYLWPRNR